MFLKNNCTTNAQNVRQAHFRHWRYKYDAALNNIISELEEFAKNVWISYNPNIRDTGAEPEDHRPKHKMRFRHISDKEVLNNVF